jgi:hypothetical protein
MPRIRAHSSTDFSCSKPSRRSPEGAARLRSKEGWGGSQAREKQGPAKQKPPPLSSPVSQAFLTTLGNGERHPSPRSRSLGNAVSRAGGLVRETTGFDVLTRDRAERTTVGRILIFRPAVEHVGPATVHRFLQFLCDRFKLRLAGGASSLLKAEAGGAERHDFCGSFFFPLGDEARLCWPSDRKFVVNPEYAAKTISRFVLSTSACVMS